MQFVPDAESIEFIMHTGYIIDLDCGKGLMDMRILTFSQEGLPKRYTICPHLTVYRNKGQ